MPIIDRVGRKKPQVRVFILGMHLLLTLGAVTMVYPFLLMLSASIRTEVDREELGLIPGYLFQDKKLYQKYLYDRYSGVMVTKMDFSGLNEAYGTDYLTFDEVPFAEISLTDPEARRRVKDWEEFRAQLSERYKRVGFRTVRGATGRVERSYQRWVEKKFKGNLGELNKAYTLEYESFQTVFIPYERYWNRIWQPAQSVRMREWEQFKANLDEEYKVVISGEGMWQTWLWGRYGKDINLLNKQYHRQHQSFGELPLSPCLPESKVEQSDWAEFMRERWPLQYLRVNGGEEEYQGYLQNKYYDIANLNEIYRRDYRTFTEIPLLQLSREVPGNKGGVSRIVLFDWGVFVKEKLSPVYMEADSSANRYREFLRRKYEDLSRINQSYDSQYDSWLDICPPYRQSDLADLMKVKRSWRRYFLVKNYAIVIDYILLHGRAVLITAIFCMAVIATTLTVNPLCAFALSRFKLRGTSKILLFLLATMAFPAEVTMIPNFLLLKQFGMLNTYWALILPGMANGFSIFLLKGFFDSLPRELYESATIAGASELRIFYQITMPLAKPVMAYLALGAFTGAYGSFMYALLVCQNPQMWTIMVWLYEMQLWAPSFVQMAAFALATVPTFLVFIFAQKIIMRGIILPVEH